MAKPISRQDSPDSLPAVQPGCSTTTKVILYILALGAMGLGAAMVAHAIDFNISRYYGIAGLGVGLVIAVATWYFSPSKQEPVSPPEPKKPQAQPQPVVKPPITQEDIEQYFASNQHDQIASNVALMRGATDQQISAWAERLYVLGKIPEALNVMQKAQDASKKDAFFEKVAEGYLKNGDLAHAKTTALRMVDIDGKETVLKKIILLKPLAEASDDVALIRNDVQFKEEFYVLEATEGCLKDSADEIQAKIDRMQDKKSGYKAVFDKLVDHGQFDKAKQLNYRVPHQLNGEMSLYLVKKYLGIGKYKEAFEFRRSIKDPQVLEKLQEELFKIDELESASHLSFDRKKDAELRRDKSYSEEQHAQFALRIAARYFELGNFKQASYQAYHVSRSYLARDEVNQAISWLLKIAIEFKKLGQFDEARIALMDIIHPEGEIKQFLFNLIEEHLKAGRFDQAFSVFRSITFNDEDNLQLLPFKMQCAQGLFDTASKELDAFLLMVLQEHLKEIMKKVSPQHALNSGDFYQGKDFLAKAVADNRAKLDGNFKAKQAEQAFKAIQEISKQTFPTFLLSHVNCMGRSDKYKPALLAKFKELG